MTRYRKKPVEVEAWQVGSDDDCPAWIFSARPLNDGTGRWFVVLDDGSPFPQASNINEGDYIVYEDGYFSIEKIDCFEQTYEAVNDAED